MVLYKVEILSQLIVLPVVTWCTFHTLSPLFCVLSFCRPEFCKNTLSLHSPLLYTVGVVRLANGIL